MNKRYVFSIIVALILGVMPGWSKADRQEKSYNFSRAVEELQNGNKDEAVKFLNLEIRDNPKNGYAYLSLAVMQMDSKDFDKAMSSVNKAINLIPRKDKEFSSRASEVRGRLYAEIGDTLSALNDFASAIKMYPENEEAFENRAQIFYEQERFPESDSDYEALIKLNPASPMGYMGLGRNANARGDFEGAIKLFDKVIRLYEDYSSGYSFRAESYLKLGKYAEAADDFMKALAIDNDAKAHLYLFEFPAEQTALIVAKLNAQASKNPYDAKWQYYIGQVYHDKGMYKEAVDALGKAYDIDAFTPFLLMQADCLQELGEFGKAYEILNRAEQLMPGDDDILQLKADVLGEGGDIEGALEIWSQYIEKNPDDVNAYYRRGFFEDNSGRTDEALKDYNMVVLLKPNFAYGWLGKADMHVRRGETKEAMEAYNKVVELDTIPDSNSCAMYAFLALGRKDEAINFMEKVIEEDPDKAGNYYDGACFYSRVGDLDKSLAMLRTSFEKGFKRFHHVMADDDLEALRETEGFKKLMEEFATPSDPKDFVEKAEESATIVEENERIEIPITPDGGCYSVKCSINDLPLSFIFDTGASTVSISQLEANFMLKNGYLRHGDFVGSGRFMDANGNVTEGSLLNLREVEFGGIKLTNVKASVVRNQKAPLLLGQSVLQRVGSIEIDNAAKKLIIKTH